MTHDTARYYGLYRDPPGTRLADSPAVIPLDLRRVFNQHPGLRERAADEGDVHVFVSGEASAESGDTVTFRLTEREILHEYPRLRAVDVRPSSGTALTNDTRSGDDD